MSVLPKAIYRFNTIATKIPMKMIFFVEVGKNYLSIHMESKFKQQKIILGKKKNIVVGLTHPDFKTYCKVTVIETVWYWHEDR